VLDIDVKKGQSGLATLRALERQHGRLPETRKHGTPSGGLHLLFKCDARTAKIENRVSIGPGLDVRADDCGQVVMPPSTTEAGDGCVKGRYKLLTNLPIAAAPQWLIDAIMGGSSSEHEPFELPGRINDGERDDTLFRYACQLRHQGRHHDQILAALRLANKRCRPPLTDKELVAKARSAGRYTPSSGQNTSSDEPDQIDPEKHRRSLAEIMRDKKLKVRWIVRDLLAQGALPVFCGSPKTGKTTLMVHLVMQIKGQVPTLGEYEAADGAEQYPIGYFNEMGEINFRKAVKAVKPDITAAEVDDLLETVSVYGQWPTLNEWGLQQLEASITKHSFRLFVIDTIARIRPAFKGLSASEADAKIMSQIAAIARRTNCCIVVMTQGNKRGGEVENITDRLAHTNQFAAAADDIITLYRKKNDETRRRYLQCVGRNVQESDEMVVVLNHEGLKIEGRTYDILMSETQRRIIDCLKLASPDALTPSAIAEVLNEDAARNGGNVKVSRENIRNIVRRMIIAQTVVHVGKRGQVTTPSIAAKHWLDETATNSSAKARPKALAKALPKALTKGTLEGTAKGHRGVVG
jgi:hypothetical protein